MLLSQFFFLVCLLGYRFKNAKNLLVKKNIIFSGNFSLCLPLELVSIPVFKSSNICSSLHQLKFCSAKIFEISCLPFWEVKVLLMPQNRGDLWWFHTIGQNRAKSVVVQLPGSRAEGGGPKRAHRSLCSTAEVADAREEPIWQSLVRVLSQTYRSIFVSLYQDMTKEKMWWRGKDNMPDENFSTHLALFSTYWNIQSQMLPNKHRRHLFLQVFVF